MALKVTIKKTAPDGSRTDEILDEFTVEGDVVALEFSDRCEMNFTLADGTQISSVDIKE